MASSLPAAALVVIVAVVLAAAAGPAARADSARRRHEYVLRYYATQQFGVNEFANINASVAAVNGTRTGVGLGVVYAYPIASAPPNASTNGTGAIASLGFIRGTSAVASNTLPATVFVVKTVVRYSNPAVKRTPKSKTVALDGTFSTQGDADFNSGLPWEYAVVGGTGSFRNTYGYTIGRPFSRTPSASGASAVVVTAYETHLWI